ncbi:MAG: hypothetical protein JW754_02920 [Candidatus Aenigmarchaeota archaeon]|nr:hypothetical protein [Candidatus Aenigmarchaeota archaeon]
MCNAVSPDATLVKDVVDVSQVPYRTIRSFSRYDEQIQVLGAQAAHATADQMIGPNSPREQLKRKREKQIGLVTSTIKRNDLDPAHVLKLIDEGRGIFVTPDFSDVLPEEIDMENLENVKPSGWVNFMNAAAPFVLPLTAGAVVLLANQANAFESASSNLAHMKYVNAQIERGMIPLPIISDSNSRYVMASHEPIRANLPSDTKAGFTGMIQKWLDKSNTSSMSNDQIWSITRQYMQERYGVDINTYVEPDGQHIKRGSILRAPCLNQFVSYRIEQLEDYAQRLEREKGPDHTQDIINLRLEIERLQGELDKKQDRPTEPVQPQKKPKTPREMINAVNYGELTIKAGQDEMTFPGLGTNMRSRYLGDFDAKTLFQVAENLYLTLALGYGTSFGGKHTDGDIDLGDHSQSGFSAEMLLGAGRVSKPAFYEFGLDYDLKRITDTFDNVPFNIDEKQMTALVNLGIMPDGTGLGAEAGVHYFIPIGSYDVKGGVGGEAKLGLYIQKLGEAGGQPMYRASLFVFGSGMNRTINDPLAFEGGTMAANSRSLGAGAEFYFNPNIGLYLKLGQEELDMGYKERTQFIKGGLTIRGGF